MTDQQKAFEAWITSRSWYERLHCNLKQTSDGNYCHYKVNDRWVAWQAALAHASSASAEECSVDDHVAGGGKLVECLRKGFVTSESCGPDKHYILSIKFASLDDLQLAHSALMEART